MVAIRLEQLPGVVLDEGGGEAREEGAGHGVSGCGEDGYVD